MAGFLFDEHVPLAVLRALGQGERTISFARVGREDAPPRGTPDPGLLAWIEAHDYWLVTWDRATMPDHLAQHLAAGRHVPGIFVLPESFTLKDLADELSLIAGASRPNEFRDQIIYLPLRS